MNDIGIYTIQLRGPVDEDEINALSPIRIQVSLTSPASTTFTTCADQSALIGLVRRLHGLGYVFLSIERVEMSVEHSGAAQ